MTNTDGAANKSRSSVFQFLVVEAFIYIALSVTIVIPLVWLVSWATDAPYRWRDVWVISAISITLSAVYRVVSYLRKRRQR